MVVAQSRHFAVVATLLSIAFLDSMSKRLGRVISNTFMVSVDVNSG